MTKVLHIEEAAKALERCGGVPPGLEVLAVAWVPSMKCFVAKWRDPAQKEMYDDGVADPDEGEARKAYGEKPEKDMFSAIFFNDDPEGGKPRPATEILGPRDLLAMKKAGAKVVDVA